MRPILAPLGRPPLRSPFHKKSSKMLLKDLPIEILSLIVDEFLHDKATLSILSIISRPLFHICRARLFSTIRLNSPNPAFDLKCRALTDMIDKHRWMLPQIRVLELGPPILRLYNPFDTAWNLHLHTVSCNRFPSIHDERIRKLIHSAINVQNMTLRFEHQTWNNFSSQFQETILQTIRRPTLSTLNIEDVEAFPIGSLQTSSQLEDLSLICVTPAKVLPPLDADRNPSGTRRFLRGLTIHMSDDSVPLLFNALSLPSSSLSLMRLQRLSLDPLCDSVWTVLAETPAIARSIITLELRIGNQSGRKGGYGKCNLDDFPSLQTILISTSFNGNNHPINYLQQLFDNHTTLAHLERLTITLRHETTDHEQLSFDHLETLFDDADWSLLEQCLTSGRFPALHDLVVAFSPWDVRGINRLFKFALQLILRQNVPIMYSLLNPSIETFNDRFQQYSPQNF